MMHYRITNSIFHFLFVCICCLFLVLFVGCFFFCYYIFILFFCLLVLGFFSVFCFVLTLFFCLCVFIYFEKDWFLFVLSFNSTLLSLMYQSYMATQNIDEQKKTSYKINKIKVLKEDIYLDRFYLTCLYVFIVQMIIYLAYSAICRCLPANNKE